MARTVADIRQLLEQKDNLSTEQLQETLGLIKAIAEKQGILVGDSAGPTPVDLAYTQTHKRQYTYTYEIAPHLRLLGDEIRAFADGERQEYKGLLVAMPPRHGKSASLSVWTPLWMLRRNPRLRIMLASYGSEKAAEWGREARDFCLNNPEFGIQLNPNVLAASGWQTLQGGGMRTAGVGAGLAGYGSDLLIVDDPHKDAAEAYSKLIRDKVRAWFNTVALTRLEPGGFIICIHTLWHQEDLLSSLARESDSGEGLKFKTIILPAIAGKNDILGRRIGDPLWPERFPLAKLEEIRRGMSPYEWSAIYQQNPTPEDGAAVLRTWWKFYQDEGRTWQDAAWRHYEEADQVIFSFDLALKETEQGSFNVGLVLARKGAKTRVIDFWRQRCDFPTTLQKIRVWAAKYPKATAKVVEDKAAGPAIIATLAKEIIGVVPMQPTGSKLVRLQAVIPLIEAGNTELPHTDICKWSSEIVEECAAFGAGAQFDDIVDTLSQGLRYLHPQVWAHLDKQIREGVESEREEKAWSEEAEMQKAHTKFLRRAVEETAKAHNGEALRWQDPRRYLC